MYNTGERELFFLSDLDSKSKVNEGEAKWQIDAQEKKLLYIWTTYSHAVLDESLFRVASQAKILAKEEKAKKKMVMMMACRFLSVIKIY